MDDQLQWYLAHRRYALSSTDQRLITFTKDDLPSMPIGTKKEWIRQLDAVKRTWAMERLQRQKGQTIITNFFSSNHISEEIMVS